jgi:hypothetical protein
MKKISVLIVLLFVMGHAQISIISRVGFSSYDWLFTGPIHKWCITDTVANGIHICWTYSNFVPAVDLNARYNFYNFTNWNWNWFDGVNVFTQRSAFRSMDNHPITGCVYILGNNMIARDLASGAGLFEFSTVPNNLLYPIIAVTPDDVVHCLYKDNIDGDTLLYSRNWSSPININSPAPGPTFPSYNFAGSKISNKLIAVWLCDEETVQARIFYRISNNSGIIWEAPVQLPYPPTVISSPTFNDYSLYAMFDAQDNFHIVTAVSERGFAIPAEIWHFCPINNPQWSLVSHYDAETLSATVGYNAIFACRPTIVQNYRDNYLYVAWEQFDSLNYEPLTTLARADIWIAESPNNGLSWQNQRPITTPNTTSKRFPCAGGVDHDTLTVAYLIDSIAGFEIMSQGRATLNPIVIQRIKVPLPSGVEEHPLLYSQRPLLNAEPNPFTSHTTIRYTLPANSRVLLSIYDVSGRLVKTLVDELKSPGVYSVCWNCRDDNNRKVAEGIYFYILETPKQNFTKKLVLMK